MLRRVQTIGTFEAEEKALTGALEKLRGRRKDALKELEDLEGKVQGLQEQEEETANNLSKMHEEAQLFEDSVKTTNDLMARYGLVDQDFKNMMYLITRAGAPGKWGETMERVNLLLGQYRTLSKLESEIKGRSETLQKLNSEIGKAEERLATSTKAFTNESKKIESFVANIQAAAKKSTDATIATLTRLEAMAAKDLERALGDVTEKATGSLEDTQAEASADLGELLKQSREILGDIKYTNNDLAKELGTLVKDTFNGLLKQSKIILDGIQSTMSHIKCPIG